MGTKKVNVIMPTYNGEQYVGEQIESIFAQTYDNIDIYIRDDKSSDNTIEVIKSYIGKEPVGKKLILADNENTNWGYVRNVFDTLKLTEKADYYAFCDQDDFWLPEKIEKQVEMLEKHGDVTPALCFTAFNFCNSKLEYMRSSTTMREELFLKDVIFDFKVLNFNIMINNALREELFIHLPTDQNGKNFYPKYPDLWMSQIAGGYKALYCVTEPMVKYRRNENAASSFNTNSISFFLWRFKKLILGDESKLLKKAIKQYVECYYFSLDDKDKKMVDVLTKPSFINYFKKVFYPGKFRATFKDEIGLRIFWLIGKL